LDLGSERAGRIWLNVPESCWDYPVKDNTVKLAVVWFSLSFGYYGLSVWFPDVIKHLQADEYASRVKIHNNETIEDFTFNFTLENQIHKNGVFINDRFIGMKFKSVTFIDSTFQSCYFEDVSSIGSFFKNCTIIEAFFYNTDIDDSKFIGSSVINATFAHNKTGCQMTFDDDYSAYWVYFINFLGTLAVLPGNIVSALLMDKVGRLSMLGGSMVLSGISCFFLWFGTSESMMIAMLCLYNGLSISAWNSLDVVTAELYPTNRRGTGFGFCNAMCKLAAVLGNLIFGSLVGITKSIPILLASSVLVTGGLLEAMEKIYIPVEAPQVLGIVEEFHTLIGNFWKYNNWVIGHIVETHRTGTVQTGINPNEEKWARRLLYACLPEDFSDVSDSSLKAVWRQNHIKTLRCVL
ncbi:hypothetical protein cypCar_00016826, partial [Cyprinus carpio]